jgi:16S rRNA (uracil1498-N3)-methyltransferase
MTFFAPPSAVHGRRLVLPPSEAHHATRVLRHEPGDEIWVVDGAGARHRVRLDQAGEGKTVGTILETREETGEPPYHLTLGLGLLKKRSRYETFLEKAVELGAARLIPLSTRYAERDTLRRGRAERLLRAALKQSGRSRLPRLDAPTPLPDLLADTPQPSAGRTFLAHRRAEAGDPSLAEGLKDMRPDGRLRVLVGPEGGFSDSEVEAAEDAGATVVSLGPRRLRAETAALAAGAAVMLALNG